jgi:GT2 family glycosyltransferase
MSRSSISVIVLTHNSYQKKQGCIEHTLAALLNQRDVNHEIIVVDNDSSAQDLEKLGDFVKTKNERVRLIACDETVSGARNLGAGVASHELFVFVDEDTIVLDDDALLKISKHSLKSTHGYGALRLWTPDEPWFSLHAKQVLSDIAKKDYAFLRESSGRPAPHFRSKNTDKYLVRSFIGNFGFVQKALFEKVGGFPQNFAGYGSEDDALSFLCYHHCGKFALISDIEVVHVSHSVEKAFFNTGPDNWNLYKEMVRSYGYSSFHIGDLLYPEIVKNRAVLE